MFKIRMDINTSKFDRLRDWFPRAKALMETEQLPQVVQPQVEADVQELLAPYPGAVSRPFEFSGRLNKHGIPVSQAFYFWAFRVPYQRQNTLFDAWRTALAIGGIGLTVISADVAIVITNEDEAAPFTYGPRLVIGHYNTGWPRPLDNNTAEVLRRARRYIRISWRSAVWEAIGETP